MVTKLRAVLGAAAVVASAAPLAAQGPGPAGRPGPGMRGGLARYLADHPQSLDLNDAQTARLRRVAQWAERADSGVHAQMKSARGTTAPRDLSAEQRYQLMRQMRPLADQLRTTHYAVVDSLHAILTPVQWQRLDDQRMGMRRGAAMRRGARAWGRGNRRGFAPGRAGPRGPGAGFGWGPPF
jgi:hypothetical protein